ncbi:MAG: asparagine synthase B [Candidatus Eiseniibacteriota bacterium]|jgi:asparagine synthase (glutamine-hydrolysing)
MCGIAGLWGGRDERLIAEMMTRLHHRGPDADGIWSSAHKTLGHRRLSIMDPAGGDQPIHSADRRRVIVGNGEIYNFPALRRELEADHGFRTRSDTEVALHLWEEEATGVAERLDGMFAFAIADDDQLFLARDPVGIKPLYTGSLPGGGRVFASELKALVGVASDVHEFPAGTWYHSQHGYRRFYDVPCEQVEQLSVAEHCRRIRTTLERAVEKRMMSDVPLGAFLSGGLDSSVIAAIARQHVDELHTFSVGVEGSDDLEAARTVARHLDTVHHEYVLTLDEVLERLPEIVYHLESYDQDLVRSAIPCYFTSRLASEHVKVILTGEGADELFAGYTYYKGIPDDEALRDELRRSVQALHNVNLQRVDRLTMAHSIEGRVPFLDTELIRLAQTVPARLKLRRSEHGVWQEKWILRKACEDLLPPAITWRVKAQFDEGSGTVDLLGNGLERFLLPEEAGPYRRLHRHAALRSNEEAVYHRLLDEAYDGSAVVLDNVARWADRPVAHG